MNRWIEDTYTEFGKLDGAANVAGVAGGDGDTTVETIVGAIQCLFKVSDKLISG